MAIILDGKVARAFYTEQLKERIKGFSRKPVLAVIQVGDREESNAYIKQKIKFANETSFKIFAAFSIHIVTHILKNIFLS